MVVTIILFFMKADKISILTEFPHRSYKYILFISCPFTFQNSVIVDASQWDLLVLWIKKQILRLYWVEVWNEPIRMKMQNFTIYKISHSWTEKWCFSFFTIRHKEWQGLIVIDTYVIFLISEKLLLKFNQNFYLVNYKTVLWKICSTDHSSICSK